MKISRGSYWFPAGDFGRMGVSLPVHHGGWAPPLPGRPHFPEKMPRPFQAEATIKRPEIKRTTSTICSPLGTGEHHLDLIALRESTKQRYPSSSWPWRPSPQQPRRQGLPQRNTEHNTHGMQTCWATVQGSYCCPQQMSGPRLRDMKWPVQLVPGAGTPLVWRDLRGNPGSLRQPELWVSNALTRPLSVPHTRNCPVPLSWKKGYGRKRGIVSAVCSVHPDRWSFLLGKATQGLDLNFWLSRHPLQRGLSGINTASRRPG